MSPIDFGIQHIVQEIRGASREAERKERQDRCGGDVGVGQAAGSQGGGADEQILDPLPRPHRDDKCS
jgi:hypothetical protein